MTSAPNSNFVAANGQCISRTTYAAYFALVSTTYGICDGTTTFGTPDLRGRVAAMLDGGANRLTSAATGCGTAFTALGVTCAAGTESKTLLTANLPPYTPSGTIVSTSVTTSSTSANQVGSGGSFTDVISGAGNSTTAVTTTTTSIFTGTPAPGQIGNPMASVQPTYGINVFVRIL